MIKVIPVCQEHDEELRQEHLIDEQGRGYMSGYCAKCAKHYRLCTATRYMDHCVKRQNHDGEHQDSGNHIWNGEFHP